MIEMDFNKLPAWLENLGPYSDIVFLSRITFNRNISNYPFQRKANKEDRIKVLNTITEGLKAINNVHKIYRIDELDETEKLFLFERNLLNQHQLENGKFSGVAFNINQSNSFFINTDEHLKFSSISPGYNVKNPFRECDYIDDLLFSIFDFSYDEEFGFLTSSIYRVGTGMQVEIFLHLPATVITGDITELMKHIEENNFSMEGVFGVEEGIIGSIFIIENKSSLGETEEEILEKTDKIVKKAVDIELTAREYLIEKAPYETEDKIWRSYGIMKNARLLNREDFLNLTSAIRMGVGLGLIKDIDLLDINKWLIINQPGHIRIMNGNDIKKREENAIRASQIRKDIGGI